MKRKLTFALVTVAALGGAWSCFSMGQDPFGPAQAPRSTVKRYLNSADQAELITIAGVDFAATTVGAPIQGENALAKNVSMLAKQFKSAEGTEKENVALKLKAAVGEQFDFRHDGKAKELAALEEQLAKLKEIHNKRTQQRDRIIADRVQQILLEVDSLGWGVADSSESSNRFTTSPGWDVGSPREIGIRKGFAMPPLEAPTAIVLPAGSSVPKSPLSISPPNVPR